MATVAALPVLGSVAGDARITLDTFAVYVFNGTTWTSIAGTGDVVGPASSVNNALVQFSGVTGKLLKNLALGTANQVLGMTNAATDQEYKTLSVGTTGTDFAIAHAANSVAFNLPDASATARGVITTGVQTIAGVKTFSSTITGSISGNAATVTTNANLTGVVTSVGNATSFATSPTFTGTVTIPTPFTIGAVSMTATGTQLNYLNAATGTTGTTSTNVVFSTSPTLVTPVLGVASATSMAIGSATSLFNLSASIISAAATDTNGAGVSTNASITDTTSFAAGVGGGLGFSGYYSSTPDRAVFGAIKALKTNSTTGDYGGGLGFYTRANGSSIQQALLLGGDKSATFAGSVTATAFIPSSASVPTNGMYLAAANIPSIAANSTYVCGWSSTQMEIVKTLVLTAGQIQFPASQNASSDANTLDDYEEGTWTPTWRGSGGSAGTASATGANGIYSKVGNMVFVTGYLPTTNLGSWSGTLILGGLPFTPRVSFYTGLMVQIWSGLGTNKIMQPMYINSNSTDFNPTAIAAATTFNTELTVADITASFYVRFSGTFLV